MGLEFVTELSSMLTGLTMAPIYMMVPLFSILIGVSAAVVAKDIA